MDLKSCVNIPNLLSFSRLPLALAVVYFVLQKNEFYALLVLGTMFATDFLDGVIARRTKQENRVGKILDSGFDYLAVIIIIPSLISYRMQNWILLPIMVCLLLAIGAYYFIRLAGNKNIHGTVLGKPYMTIAIACSYIALITNTFWQIVIAAASLLWFVNILLFLKGHYRKNDR